VVGAVVLLVFYVIYCVKFNYYIDRKKINLKDPKFSRIRGQAPPSFPNGNNINLMNRLV